MQDNMTIAQDEIFGPVMALMKFKYIYMLLPSPFCQSDSWNWKSSKTTELYKHCRTVEEVIQKANNTRYGLAAGIVTKNIDIANTVSRSIRAGAIWINCYFAFDPDAPFGGYKMSGFGKDMGMDALEKYLQTKTVVIPLYNTPWLWSHPILSTIEQHTEKKTRRNMSYIITEDIKGKRMGWL